MYLPGSFTSKYLKIEQRLELCYLAWAVHLRPSTREHLLFFPYHPERQQMSSVCF